MKRRTIQPSREGLSIRITSAERGELALAAQGQAKDLSSYIRDAALAAARGTITIGAPLARHIEERAGLRGMSATDYINDLMLTVVPSPVTPPEREPPKCDECGTDMHPFGRDGISGWSCDTCGWSYDDPQTQ